MSGIYIAPRQTAGLNNLKMVIFGMTEMARKTNGKYCIPADVFDFTPTENGIGDSSIPISDLFDMEALLSFFSDSWEGEGECIRLGNAEYLQATKDVIQREAGKDDIAQNRTAMGFASFKPCSPLKQEIDGIIAQLPPSTCALQLRVERDWQEYAARKGWIDGTIAGNFEVVLNHRRIFEKIRATPSIPQNIFVCCDEEDLMTPKSQIKKDARDYNLDLIFKSDLNTASTSRLKKSIIDFEVCLGLGVYIGTRRSTFSNILCMVKAAAQAAHPEHYLYDTARENLETRDDFGRA